jgi:hypothetical protein
MIRRARLIRILSLFAVSLAFEPVPGAAAMWSAHGPGSAAGAASVMPAGAEPSGSPTGTSVTVSWEVAAFPDGVDVAGYVINRYNAGTGAPASVGAGCSGVVTATTCTEQSVPPGTWVYTDTPAQLSWSGAPSPDSASIVVR